MNWYPLLFEPIIKERIWGGTKLRDILHKPLVSEISGESWELSTVPGDVSVVANGVLAGNDLNAVVASNPEAVLGKKVVAQFGTQFPLLFKFLDAREDLSIQVHPNDALAKERHNSFGKTEMWYVIQADPSSKLIVGFKEDSSKEDYISNLKQNTLLNLLEEYPVQKGDVFFLETGTVHAIGAGTVIAEIQQTSDITYRLYDWDRVDANGEGRALHTDLALDAINFTTTESKINYNSIPNQRVEIVTCPFFTTSVLAVDKDYLWKKKKNAFTVFMCVEGKVEVHYNADSILVTTGETLLLPAEIEQIDIKGNATLLEISI